MKRNVSWSGELRVQQGRLAAESTQVGQRCKDLPQLYSARKGHRTPGASRCLIPAALAQEQITASRHPRREEQSRVGAGG
ncbi:hypothetical protein PFLUV_G00032400 [Perca fluviatilis]|uniref:Uncharacterized protein n=1 Tax=Perca fluviatilis TaxID=8168 RepID=A0A6A5FID1_PERFL|nr:hypothetical protein PFLUV_G00032400 [Perca fluviatilis]